GGAKGDLKVWDVRTKEARNLPVAGAVTSLAFHPRGRLLAVGHGYPGRASSITLWDLERDRRVHARAGHAGHVWSLAFSPDGGRLASVGEDRTVRLWDAGTGRELLRLEGDPFPASPLAFAPDGRRLALAGKSGVKVWDAPP